MSGCSTSHYRRAADKDVYQIIERAEQKVLGQSTNFTIATPYSHRKVSEVEAKEIIQRRQEPGSLSLTIEKALNVAIKNSREYQTHKEQLYLTALSLTDAQYKFNPHFYAGGSAAFNRDSDGQGFGTADSKIGVAQLLKSGASLSLSLANDFVRYFTGNPARSAASVISVDLAQPLLRGAGSSIVAEDLTQAQRNVIYGLRSYSQYQRQFAVNIVIAYFQLLQNQDQLVNAYNDYQRRLETIKYTEALGEAGRQSQLDVDEAKSEEFIAKNSYLLAATTYLNNLDRFKLTLGIPLTTKVHLDDTPLEELKKNGVMLLSIDQNRALQIAIGHQLDLLNSIDQFEDSKRKVKVAANRLKPDLNIFANAQLDSQQPTDYTKFDLDQIPNLRRHSTGPPH